MVLLIRNHKKRTRRPQLPCVDEENHEPIAPSNSREHSQKQGISRQNDENCQNNGYQDNPGFHNLDNNDTDIESIDACPITPKNILHAMESCREGIDTLKPCPPTLAIEKEKKANTANRFTDAQRGRTLCHHKLIQPTPSQERAHLSKLRGYHETVQAFPSQMSLQSLPEEGSDQEEAVVQLDLKHMQSCEKDAGTATRRNSSDTCSTKMSSSVGDFSVSRSIAGSIEGDAFSEVSPTTTLFVPIQGSAEFNLSMFSYCQPCEMEPHSPSHRFVICADSQFGIATNNENWQAEMDYSVCAVNLINKMDPQPAFVCVCGDLGKLNFRLLRDGYPDTCLANHTIVGRAVDMEFSFEVSC